MNLLCFSVSAPGAPAQDVGVALNFQSSTTGLGCHCGCGVQKMSQRHFCPGSPPSLPLHDPSTKVQSGQQPQWPDTDGDTSKVTFGLANEGELLQAAGFIPMLFVAAVSGAPYKIRGSRAIECLDSVMKGQSSKISFLRSQQFKPFCSVFKTSCRQEQSGQWLYVSLPLAEALLNLFKKRDLGNCLVRINSSF